MRILVVEDDVMIGGAIKQALQDAAYAVDWERDVDAANGALLSREHDAVLLDLNLGVGDGLTVLSALRKRDTKIPVIIMTARDQVQDRIAGLDAGADDYLVKPFDFSEMLARLRAATRRLGDQADATLGNGKMTLDPITHTLNVDGIAHRLSSREFAVLRTLLARPGSIYSRRQLEEKVYGWEESVESNVVEFLIHSIRKKAGQHIIRNVRGVGWMVDKE